MRKRIFGPKGDEVTREWRKLINEELNDMYSCYVETAFYNKLLKER